MEYANKNNHVWTKFRCLNNERSVHGVECVLQCTGVARPSDQLWQVSDWVSGQCEHYAKCTFICRAVEAGICTVGSTILPFIRNLWEASIYLVNNYLGISQMPFIWQFELLQFHHLVQHVESWKWTLSRRLYVVLKLPSVAATVQSTSQSPGGEGAPFCTPLEATNTEI